MLGEADRCRPDQLESDGRVCSGRAASNRVPDCLSFPSQAVHTIAMRFPIDVVFLDRNWRVIHVQPALAPFRMTGMHWKARLVIELPVGVIAQTSTSVGDELLIEE